MASELLVATDDGVILTDSTDRLMTLPWVVRMPYFTTEAAVDAADAAAFGWPTTGWAAAVNSTNYHDRVYANALVQSSGSGWFSDKPFPNWFRVTFPSAVKLVKYSIIWTGGGTRYNESLDIPPRNWNIEGSANASTWTSVQSYAQASWNAGTTYTFKVDAPQSFKYWRLITTANTGVSINKLRMYVTRV